MKTHQIVIASYGLDFPWLAHCLTSLHRYMRGFLPPVVCVEDHEESQAQRIVAECCPSALVVVKNGLPGKGMLRAMTFMMEADIYCPEADNIYLVGSDCLALRELTPDMYCDSEGRPAVLMNSYALMEKFHPQAVPWKGGVKRVLGWEPEFEFMRRLPSVFPREIFAPMREHVERRFGRSFTAYIYQNNNAGDVSEANLLGAYAHKMLPDSCCWVNIDGPDIKWNGPHPAQWPNALGQMWSHANFDYPADAVFEYDFRGEKQTATGKTPRQIIAEVLYDGDQSKVDQMGRVAP